MRRTIRTGGIRMWPEVGVFLFNWHGVPPCWRAYFLLLRQKKVAKEKATPGAAPFGFLALLGRPGGLLNSPAAQTTQADCPRPACVAQRLPRGPQRRPRSNVVPQKTGFHGQPEKTAKNEICYSSTQAQVQVVSPGPLRGAEQRRGWRKKGEDCLRAKPEFRSPRQHRVAQGTGAAGTDPGSPSFCLLFLGEARKSETPRKGGTQRFRKLSPRQVRKAAPQLPTRSFDPSL